jgi:hypothetical protein
LIKHRKDEVKVRGIEGSGTAAKRLLVPQVGPAYHRVVTSERGEGRQGVRIRRSIMQRQKDDGREGSRKGRMTEVKIRTRKAQGSAVREA